MTAKRTADLLSGYIGATVEEAMKMSKETASSGHLDVGSVKMTAHVRKTGVLLGC